MWVTSTQQSTRQIGTMHLFRQTRTSKTRHNTSTTREFFLFFSFIPFQQHRVPLSNRTFEMPRMTRMRREVLISLHKIRCAHREPSVDTVIREVVWQVAFQEFVYFSMKLYNIYEFWQSIAFRRRKKLTVSSERFVTRVSCGPRVPRIESHHIRAINRNKRKFCY